MSARQLFSQRAGRGGLHIGTQELAACLQQLGLVDPVDAGRLALAAARLGGGRDDGPGAPGAAADPGDIMNLGGEPCSVSLGGFLKLMGSVPAGPGEEEEDDAAIADVPQSPGACSEEMALRLHEGRWSVRLVPHGKFGPIWSSAQVPGEEARPFGVWRPDFRATAASSLQQGLRSLVGAKQNARHFVLGDLAVRGLDAPAEGLVLQVKPSKSPPKGRGMGLALDAWLARFLPRPVAYRLLWHDRRGAARTAGSCAEIGPAGGGEGLYVWRPVPPSEVFVAVGAVVTTDGSEPKGLDVRCVPKTWLVRGDTLGPALWSLGEKNEVRVQDGLGGVIACPTENLRYVPSWSFMADKFFAGS